MFDPNDPRYDGYRTARPGPHILKVIECELTKSSKGNEMIEVKFEVVGDDPDAGATIPWNYFVIKDDSLWKLAELCRALHPKVEAFNPRDQVAINKALKGRHTIGIVEEEESTYKGKTKTKTVVNIYQYPSEHVTSKLPRSMDVSRGNVPAPTTGANPAIVNDDDIPF